MAGFTTIKEAKMKGLEVVAVFKIKDSNGKEGHKLLVKAQGDENTEIARDIFRALGKNAASVVMPSIFGGIFIIGKMDSRVKDIPEEPGPQNILATVTEGEGRGGTFRFLQFAPIENSNTAADSKGSTRAADEDEDVPF